MKKLTIEEIQAWTREDAQQNSPLTSAHPTNDANDVYFKVFHARMKELFPELETLANTARDCMANGDTAGAEAVVVSMKQFRGYALIQAWAELTKRGTVDFPLIRITHKHMMYGILALFQVKRA